LYAQARRTRLVKTGGKKTQPTGGVGGHMGLSSDGAAEKLLEMRRLGRPGDQSMKSKTNETRETLGKEKEVGTTGKTAGATPLFAKSQPESHPKKNLKEHKVNVEKQTYKQNFPGKVSLPKRSRRLKRRVHNKDMPNGRKSQVFPVLNRERENNRDRRGPRTKRTRKIVRELTKATGQAVTATMRTNHGQCNREPRNLQRGGV